MFGFWIFVLSVLVGVHRLEIFEFFVERLEALPLVAIFVSIVF